MTPELGHDLFEPGQRSWELGQGISELGQRSPDAGQELFELGQRLPERGQRPPEQGIFCAERLLRIFSQLRRWATEREFSKDALSLSTPQEQEMKS